MATPGAEMAEAVNPANTREEPNNTLQEVVGEPCTSREEAERKGLEHRRAMTTTSASSTAAATTTTRSGAKSSTAAASSGATPTTVRKRIDKSTGLQRRDSDGADKEDVNCEEVPAAPGPQDEPVQVQQPTFWGPEHVENGKATVKIEQQERDPKTAGWRPVHLILGFEPHSERTHIETKAKVFIAQLGEIKRHWLAPWAPKRYGGLAKVQVEHGYLDKVVWQATKVLERQSGGNAGAAGVRWAAEERSPEQGRRKILVNDAVKKLKDAYPLMEVDGGGTV